MFSHELDAGMKCRWKPGMLVQPGHDVVVGAGAVAVADHVDLESLGDLMVNGAQELQELAVAVPGKTLADHHSGQHVQPTPVVATIPVNRDRQRVTGIYFPMSRTNLAALPGTS